jgi:DNA (cytosine-5)-methyltransferase 1
MVLRIDEDDTRCPFVAGLEDVPTAKVLRTRDCVLTNKPYPFLSFRDGPRCAFPAVLSDKEVKQQIFHGGRLACRVVNIRIISKNGKQYSGIVRQLYHREADTSATSTPSKPGVSWANSISVEDNGEDGVVIVSKSAGKRRTRSNSIEMFDVAPPKRRASLPTKPARYTFGDVFCGAGGASQGAKQAGLLVTWGLDSDKLAIHAYNKNHAGAHAFHRNAHDFPPKDYTNEDLRVDILHLSPPCCYFSPAQ